MNISTEGVHTTVHTHEPSHPDITSAREAARVLDIALNVPSYGFPVGCIGLLLGCIKILEDCFDRELLMSHGRMLTNMMRFLTTHPPGTEQEQMAWNETTLRQCNCKHGPAIIRNASPRLHLDFKPAPQVFRLIDAFANILTRLESQHGVSWRSLYLKHSTQQRWPCQVTDLLPVDLSNSFYHMGSWCCLDPYKTGPGPPAGLGYLLSLMIRTSGPHAVPAIIKSITVWLHISLSNTSAVEPRITVLREGPTLSQSYISDDRVDVFCASTRLLYHVLRRMFDEEIMLWLSPEGDKDEIIMFIMITLTRMHNTLEQRPASKASKQIRQLQMTHGDPYSEVLVRYLHSREVAQGVDREFQEAQNDQDCSTLPGSVGSELLHSRSLWRSNLLWVIAETCGTSWQHRCWGPECLRTANECGRRFRACSGCMLAEYCSRSCQRNAWRHPEAPHRDVCSTLVLFRTFRNLPWKDRMEVTGDGSDNWNDRYSSITRDSIWLCRLNILNLKKAKFATLRTCFQWDTIMVSSSDQCSENHVASLKLVHHDSRPGPESMSNVTHAGALPDHDKSAGGNMTVSTVNPTGKSDPRWGCICS
jgi:hypothetical protein